MTEVGDELLSAAFQFLKDATDGIPIPIGGVLEPERKLEERGFEPGCAIDEKHACFDVMFFTEFLHEPLCQHGRSGRIESDVQEFVGVGWNGVLVVKDIEGTETASVEEQRLVRILQASELETDLEHVIQRVLD